MKVSREEAARNRERVLEAASSLYRERGFDGVGVAELMRSVGLTHGGFYGQFASKEDLMAQACAHALNSASRDWRNVAAQSARPPLEALADWYLSAGHRDHPGIGCALAALGAEAARQGPAVRRAVTRGMEPHVELLASWMPERSRQAKRRRAVLALSSMVGAMVLARVVDDEALSAEFLETVARALQHRPSRTAGVATEAAAGPSSSAPPSSSSTTGASGGAPAPQGARRKSPGRSARSRRGRAPRA